MRVHARKATRGSVVTILVLLVLAAALLALPACAGKEASDASGESAGTRDRKAGSAEEAVENFYSSKTKHGFATFHSGSEPDEKVEFWFNEDGRYRLTWYYAEEDAEDIEAFGPIRIHMISTDGKLVYFCRPETELSEISYTLAEKQQWTFNGPPDWSPGAGEQEGEYTVFTYTPEKLWDIEGADQQFYLYDMKIYAKDNQIEKIVMRTNSSKVPVEELVESQFTIDEFELDVEIDPEMFELPYPTAGQ